MAAQKDFDSLNSASETESATLHGVVAAVSPMKYGGKAEFFEAKLTDGDAHMRLVGFSAGQRKRLASFQDRLEAVTIENCQVKKSRQSDELEVLLRSASRVQSSPKKFNIGDITKLTTSEITLSDLSTKNTFDKVSVPAKVLRVDDPVKVSDNLTKQDIVVVDSTSAAKLTVWEANVGCVTEGESYRFVNLVVRSYQHSKYLSLLKDGGHIEKSTTLVMLLKMTLPKTLSQFMELKLLES